MATKTAMSKGSNDQPKQRARPGLAPIDEPAALAAEVSVPSEGGGTYWGDRFAFKIWLFCFLLMALMVAYDAIHGLLRGSGSN